MAVRTFRDVNLKLNNRDIVCNSISLNQETEIISPFLESESISINPVPTSPVSTRLNFSYYLTGKDYLRDFIFTNRSNPISGFLGGLFFTQGYLESYSLNGVPNSPLNINATIRVCDELSGNLLTTVPKTIINGPVWHFSDSYFNNYSYSENVIDNVVNYSWNYKTEINPVYYQLDSGIRAINPDFISFGPKEISCDISCDNENIPLRFSGETLSLELVCRDSSRSIAQTYPVSGLIFRKSFDIRENDISKTNFSINQSHVNDFPKIETVDTSTYPTNNYILIYAPTNNTVNGFFSDTNNFSLVEKVVLGDRELSFSASRLPTYDVITGYIPNDAINGYLQVYTTKGMVSHQTPIALNYNNIGISGFSPDTGKSFDSIIISGSNFNRVDAVYFNGRPALFNVFDVTGTYHKIIASVPNSVSLGKISVVSSQRNRSGISTGIFYPRPQITGFTPTGVWSGVCEIYGDNFSGISNVYFNNIRSTSFTVNSNQLITARIPGTGAGFTKGYIKLSGYKGLESLSNTKYQPIVKISGVSLLSGGIERDITLSGIFDPSFLYPLSGGFGVAFKDKISPFYQNGRYTLTGLIPSEYFGSASPAMLEPDGVTRYDDFVGNFIQMTPPTIFTVNNSTSFLTKRYKFYDISLQGTNLEYFIGIPHCLVVSGRDATNRSEISYYNQNQIVKNDLGTQIIVSGVRVTGIGGYIMMPVNVAGTGTSAAVLYNNNDVDRLELSATAIQSTTSLTSLNNGIYINNGVAANAIDLNNEYSFSSTFPFGTSPDTPNTSGFLSIIFSQLQDIGGISFYGGVTSRVQGSDSTTMTFLRNDNHSPYNFTDTFFRASTGTLQAFTQNTNGSLTPLYTTAISFDDGIVALPRITGVKAIRLYRNDGENRYLAFAGIVVV